MEGKVFITSHGDVITVAKQGQVYEGFVDTQTELSSVGKISGECHSDLDFDLHKIVQLLFYRINVDFLEEDKKAFENGY